MNWQRRRLRNCDNFVQHSKAIDTFRGIGLLAVIWSHAGLPGLPGAFVAIDAFFVISGYLITLSFLRVYTELNAQTPSGFTSYRRAALIFLEGRFRRIVLPLLATILITLGAGWFILLPADLDRLADASFMSIILAGNLHAIGTGDYFELAFEVEPLLHTWSLALEEQFYLFSLLLFAAYCLEPSRRLFWIICIGLIAVSLALSQVYLNDPALRSQNYFLFRTRIWEFLIGGVLAAAVKNGGLNGRLGSYLRSDLAYLIGWALFIVSMLVLTPASPSPGLIAVPALLGVCLVILGAPNAPLLAQKMHWRPITYLGRNLYGIYLLHFPVIVMFLYLEPPLGAALAPLTFVLSCAFAVVIGGVIERPFDRWRSPSLPKMVVFNAALLAAIGVLLLAIWTSGGAPDRMPEKSQQAYLGKFLVNPHRERCLTGELGTKGYSCSYGALSERKALLIGDSHSDVFANPLSQLLQRNGMQLQHYWYAQCPPISSQLHALPGVSERCQKTGFEAHQAMATTQGVEAVFYALLWSWYLGYEPGSVPKFFEPGQGSDASRQEFTETFIEQFHASVKAAIGRGLSVYIIAPAPVYTVNVPDTAAKTAWYLPQGWGNKAKLILPRSEYQRQRQMFDRMVAPLLSVPGVVILDPAKGLCTRLECSAMKNGVPLYYDNNHLNEAGAALVVDQWH
jgi:peptidoglycan/LPS O-acetylase OafA/YrhL